MAELSMEAVIADAVAMADVAHPDVAPFRANLELLIGCINAEARLCPEALPAIQRQLAQPLRNRLEASDWVSRRPSISRTGTSPCGFAFK